MIIINPSITYLALFQFFLVPQKNKIWYNNPYVLWSNCFVFITKSSPKMFLCLVDISTSLNTKWNSIFHSLQNLNLLVSYKQLFRSLELIHYCKIDIPWAVGHWNYALLVWILIEIRYPLWVDHSDNIVIIYIMI